jgi:hypothetical protein
VWRAVGGGETVNELVSGRGGGEGQQRRVQTRSMDGEVIDETLPIASVASAPPLTLSPSRLSPSRLLPLPTSISSTTARGGMPFSYRSHVTVYHRWRSRRPPSTASDARSSTTTWGGRRVRLAKRRRTYAKAVPARVVGEVVRHSLLSKNREKGRKRREVKTKKRKREKKTTTTTGK